MGSKAAVGAGRGDLPSAATAFPGAQQYCPVIFCYNAADWPAGTPHAPHTAATHISPQQLTAGTIMNNRSSQHPPLPLVRQLPQQRNVLGAAQVAGQRSGAPPLAGAPQRPLQEGEGRGERDLRRQD